MNIGKLNFFDKIYCINLDRRTDRWDYCKLIFDKNNLDVERFSAFDHKNTNYCNNLKHNIYYSNNRSHYGVIKNAKDNNYNNVLIFEDDVDFVDNFINIFDSKISNLPDNWDMFYIGGINKDKSYIKINNDIIKSDNIIACHSYAINSKSYDFLLRNMNILKTVPVDAFYPKYQKYLNCYLLNPSITYQRSSYSDIDLKINKDKRSDLDEI